MVLIPGLSCDWSVWESFMTRNADRYTMHAVTLPGFGKSEAPPLSEHSMVMDAVWLDNAVAAVMRLIEEKQLEKPVLMGHAMGGHLVFRIVTRNPGRFRAGISLDGAPAFPLGPKASDLNSRRAYVEETLKRRWASEDPKQYRPKVIESAATMVKDRKRAEEIGSMMADTPREVAHRYMLELMSADITHEVPNIDCPMLAIGARSDDPRARAVQTLDDVREFWSKTVKATKAPGISTVFDNTRHFIMDEAPEQLDRVVRKFLAGEPIDEQSPDVPAGGTKIDK